MRLIIMGFDCIGCGYIGLVIFGFDCIGVGYIGV